jgi:hypothetical protein
MDRFFLPFLRSLKQETAGSELAALFDHNRNLLKSKHNQKYKRKIYFKKQFSILKWGQLSCFFPIYFQFPPTEDDVLAVEKEKKKKNESI